MQNDKATILFLKYTLFITFVILAYYFLLLPQSWTLMDDYGYALRVSELKSNIFQFFYQEHFAIMNVGRFRPMDFLFRAIRHSVSNTPVFFHLFQLVMTTFIFIIYYKILKYFKLNQFSKLLIIIITSSAFCIKDMISYSTAAETLTLMFFLISFLNYLNGKYFISILFFIFCLLSKETSIIFLAPFYLITFFEKRKNFKTLIVLAVLTITLVLIVKSLPQLYTKNYTFSRITLDSILTSFFVPLIRNYGFILLCLITMTIPVLPKPDMKLFAVGAFIILFYTFILLPWGSFNSWYYSHIPIPFGWGFVLGSFLNPKNSTVHLNQMKTKICVAAICLYALAITINGSRNYWMYFNQAKEVAQKTCMLSLQSPQLPIYSNCYEASSQLMNYLKLEKICKTIPVIEHKNLSDFESTIKNKSEPFMFVYSSKCEYPIEGWMLPQIYSSKYWKIFTHDTYSN